MLRPIAPKRGTDSPSLQGMRPSPHAAARPHRSGGAVALGPIFGALLAVLSPSGCDAKTCSHSACVGDHGVPASPRWALLRMAGELPKMPGRRA